jgi:exonuclease III
MRIATWNVNSVKQRLPRLLPWLDERAPDVVCLQETKLADAPFRELLGAELDARGYEVAVHGEAAWNGVAILSRAGLDVRERWPDRRVFTYWDYRAGMFHQDLGMRIDLVLASAELTGRLRVPPGRRAFR